jgi:hypothetical protein
VNNTSGADETLTLSGLTDDKYGDITKFPGGTVLGTTCGVAKNSAGLGTLSGSSGAGAFGTSDAVIQPGGDYQCQFDAQFCMAPGTVTLPNNSTCKGIFYTDTVSATLTGDEGETVSLTPGALTVDQCISTFTQ